jgi:hypothetical protein
MPYPSERNLRPLLITRRTEVRTLARKSRKIFMTALSTLDLGEAVLKNPIIQVVANHGLEKGTSCRNDPRRTGALEA